MAICRICSKNAMKDDVWLERVNPLGEAGVFECRPACGVNLSVADRIPGAIDSDMSVEVKRDES